jgi:hypothetical protein
MVLRPFQSRFALSIVFIITSRAFSFLFELTSLPPIPSVFPILLLLPTLLNVSPLTFSTTFKVFCYFSMGQSFISHRLALIDLFIEH